MSAGARFGSRYPRGWERSSDTVETVLLTLPPDITRLTASMRLSIEAEFGGWELSRVRLYSDGTRKVLLRRKKTKPAPPPDTHSRDTGNRHTHDGDTQEPGEAQAC
ncbi:DUF5703 family protein [Gordonia sp. (in: high G+C Gram-positive bacteria)]|uniref:DUF5703 family protein n=1 Tax=Gordonia sp. (in: high G+C Gram-positive bacteria) TaxID=84139 RepID=UPI001D83DEB7|nr:DUF5703 family protein [Gordonia sp. (in: high G+C Gram-positive bacteria)]MCB1295389.1 hypothetical protein [Gordonia sp. (in: high G+C Gram-positive bacteria)]HMS75383.1 DUF5703 family protein [Gordonia sp. (in: high G+C Gram-positive bacteria)]HQV20384.1 DUF5703 family protein [Gordonia sp. (in: high G+C Gram-positive bacteria)]